MVRFFIFVFTSLRLTTYKHTVITENGVRLRLNIVDTPGYGDQVNNENWYALLDLKLIPFSRVLIFSPCILAGTPLSSTLRTSTVHTSVRSWQLCVTATFRTHVSTVACSSSTPLATLSVPSTSLSWRSSARSSMLFLLLPSLTVWHLKSEMLSSKRWVYTLSYCAQEKLELNLHSSDSRWNGLPQHSSLPLRYWGEWWGGNPAQRANSGKLFFLSVQRLH